MTPQQIVLSAVLALMVFSIALDLSVDDFKRVMRAPGPVAIGLIPQFLLLPTATWLATLALDLPANIEAAMLLVASCPGGSLSNFVTHYGRGNTALSVSITAASSVIALVALPLNFGWTMAANPVTASWLRELQIDSSQLLISLGVMLALPLTVGIAFARYFPQATARLKKPLGHVALLALFAFIVLGLMRERQLLNLGLLPILGLVVAHNALGLFLGWASSKAFGVSTPDRRAIMIEGGMQNSGLALGIIALTFQNNLGMVIVASLWGIWHIVSGLGMALKWRRDDRLAGF
jgi:BASS family bile acid:Na+ symporter